MVKSFPFRVPLHKNQQFRDLKTQLFLVSLHSMKLDPIKLFLFVGSFCIYNAWTQDIHWSQYNDNQLFLNPANAGHFNGDLRVIGNYRDQWRSVTVPFSTFSFSVDKTIKKMGVGLLAFRDQVGDGKLSTIELQGNLSYHLKLSADSTHNLRGGLNVGMNHRQVNFNSFYFDSQFDGYVFDASLPTNEVLQRDRKTNLSLGAGILYEWVKNPRLKFNVGISAFNLNRPNQGFFNEVVKRPVRTTSFVKATVAIAPSLDLIPSVQFSSQGTYQELVLGSAAKYYLFSENFIYRALYGGLWMRNKDAMILTLGYDYQELFVGLSYDINLSKLVPASNARGGFEIAVRYVINRFKPKRTDHRVCPDYI